MKPLKHLALLGIVAAGLTSCNQKELCDDHWAHAPKLDYNVNIDWQLDWQYTLPGATDWEKEWDYALFDRTYNSVRPKKPEGVRVMAYSADHENSLQNIGADGGPLYLTEGNHQLLFFNNDTEYIVFNDMYTSATAKATTRALSRSTFDASSSPVTVPGAEKTVNAPDALFGHFIEHFDAKRQQETQNLSITMKPLTFTYLVRYNFAHGFEYVGMARGALMGVASTVYLTDGHTGKEKATVLYDCVVKDGYVEAEVKSFGAPDYPNSEYDKAAQPYALNLEVRLKNGKMMNFNFDITDQMRTQPRGGVIEVGGIDIPDSVGAAGAGGFEIEVEGWGDYIDIPIM